MWSALERDSNWHDPNTRFDRELGWSPIPGNHLENWGGVTSNSLGHRSAEPAPGRGTIAWLGDSVAWGFGVPDEETAAHALDELAASEGLQVQNLAVSGFGLGQTLRHFERSLDALPGLSWVVLVIYTGNDLDDTASNARWGKRKPLWVLRDGEAVVTGTPLRKFGTRNLISNSYLLTTAMHKWRPVRDLLNSASGKVTLDPETTRRVAAQLLDRIEATALERGAAFTPVLSPIRYALEDAHADHAWFREHYRERPEPAIDLLEVMRDAGAEPDSLYIDRAHLTAEGNLLLAHTIWPLRPALSSRPGSR